MSLTYTPELETSSPCPNFSLTSVDDQNYSLKDFQKNKVLVFLFICNHCPYVKAIEDRIIQLAHEMIDQSVQFIGVCSNDPTDYQEDSKENLHKRWLEKEYGFPYLFDEEQSLAKSMGAVCTPDIFVYNLQNKKEGELAYRGRLDDSWKDESKVTRQELKEAISFILEDNTNPKESLPSMGCSIKWKNL